MNEKRIHKMLESETILEDDHPVFPDYVYIVDNIFRRYKGWNSSTIGNWKTESGIKEIRRCDMFSHPGARLGDRVE